MNFQEKYETLKEMLWGLHCPDLVERFWGYSVSCPPGTLICTECSRPDDASPAPHPCETIQLILDLEEGDQ